MHILDFFSELKFIWRNPNVVKTPRLTWYPCLPYTKIDNVAQHWHHSLWCR